MTASHLCLKQLQLIVINGRWMLGFFKMRLNRLLSSNKQSNNRSAVTLVEVVIASGLFVLLMLAAYRLFFHEVRTIKMALEHIGVNESARKLFAYMGNDIRNANWIDYPQQTNRETVAALLATNEGKICVLRRQVFDFAVKPPDPGCIREETIEYYLKKTEDGTSDLYRRVKSDLQPDEKKAFEKKICDGIRDMILYTTNRKPVVVTNFSPSMPFKSLISYEPYELDGTGPYLVHLRAAFVRKSNDIEDFTGIPLQIRTSFCVRGKLNGVHP